MTILMTTQVILNVIMFQQMMLLFLYVASSNDNWHCDHSSTTTSGVDNICKEGDSSVVDVYSQGDMPDGEITLGVNEDSIGGSNQSSVHQNLDFEQVNHSSPTFSQRWTTQPAASWASDFPNLTAGCIGHMSTHTSTQLSGLTTSITSLKLPQPSIENSVRTKSLCSTPAEGYNGSLDQKRPLSLKKFLTLLL
jgi:hypothetical protein